MLKVAFIHGTSNVRILNGKVNRMFHSYQTHSAHLYVLTPPRTSEISEKNCRTYLRKPIFDIPFMIQSYAESMKKILAALASYLSALGF